MLPEYDRRIADLAHSYLFALTGSVATANKLTPRVANGWALLAEAFAQSDGIYEHFKSHNFAGVRESSGGDAGFSLPPHEPGDGSAP